MGYSIHVVKKINLIEFVIRVSMETEYAYLIPFFTTRLGILYHAYYEFR